jgi:hypothetical protein
MSVRNQELAKHFAIIILTLLIKTTLKIILNFAITLRGC